jgi:recombinational DNA repair protein RecR
VSDPRQAEVWGKKSEVADRTLNERKFCKICEYYYSEMFTCPICYGVDREQERIIAIIDEFAENTDYPEVENTLTWLREVIKGEQDEI